MILKIVVDEIKGYFDGKFAALKDNFQEESEWAAVNARKRVRTDISISLKSMSNRKQFLFNSEVLDILDNATKAISLRIASMVENFLSKLDGRSFLSMSKTAMSKTINAYGGSWTEPELVWRRRRGQRRRQTKSGLKPLTTSSGILRLLILE
ncbi:hypothetical protein MAR_034566, partial [Mya arenaria]